MNRPSIQITLLEDRGDARGSSYEPGCRWVEFLKRIEDAHITTILPGCVRGNHFHPRRKEVLIVLFQDSWQLAWDEGSDTVVNERKLSGEGAALVQIEPLAAHAVVNTGSRPLWVLGLSYQAWDAGAPDASSRQVFPSS